jgi:hypothetical protein
MFTGFETRFDAFNRIDTGDPKDPLEDSLTYSPLKDVTNRENSPVVFLNGIERVRKSPSAARLIALLGNGSGKEDFIQRSPADTHITPRRLQDFWDTPSKPGLDEPSTADNSKIVQDLTAEIQALRSSLGQIQTDCEFHRQRAVTAQDQVDHLSRYITVLEEECTSTRNRLSEASRAFPSGGDPEKQKLIETVNSMETLNKSLSRQNDLLRSRSSVTRRFEKKDIKIQTDVSETVSVGTETDVIPTPRPSPPPIIEQRSEIHLDHLLNAPAVKVSRVLYIKDAEIQTDPCFFRDPSPVSHPVRLPIPSRIDPQFVVLPLREDSPKGIPRGLPYRTAQRARRSLPSYPVYPNSPGNHVDRGKGAIPLVAPVQGDVSPVGWQAEWRAISSSRRRGKSTGSMNRPRWVP